MLLRHYLSVFDALLLVVLMGYVTLGTEHVPFHGDESTTIWMSRDYDTIVLKHDFAAVEYQAPPRRTTDQHMRIVTSNLSKLAMGIAWSRAGMSVDEINDQWVWGADLAWNQANGHVPSPKLLLLSRLTSAWLTAISVVFVLAIGRLLGKRLFTHPAAVAMARWGAAVLYALHPAVLLNGRRAMFEGGLLFGLTLAACGVLMLAARIPHAGWRVYMGAGIAAGLALSTKHSAAFTVVLLYTGLGGGVLLWNRDWQQFAKIGLATSTAVIVFLVLNPLWWSQPLAMPRIVINERQKLLDEQAALFGGYADWGERVKGLWDESLRATPQYFEADYWGNYRGVKEEIAAYESSHLAGWINGTNIMIFAIRLLLTVSGAATIGWGVFRGHAGTRRILLLLAFWTIGILMVSLLSVPLQWQRYYLPVQPPLAVVMGLGLGTLVERWWRRRHVAL